MSASRNVASVLVALCLACASALLVAGCGEQGVGASSLDTAVSFATTPTDPLSSYPLTGAVHPVLDPSVAHQGNEWYVFGTDVKGASLPGHLNIHCSSDTVTWKKCGSVFSSIPQWIQSALPGVKALWAPDISYFNGSYHLYYAASITGTQQSVIGLATNATLDPNNAAYSWVDRGQVLASSDSDNFNAIDPNILVDSDGSVYLTFGSYWSGIKQIKIDPSTGMPSTGASLVALAARPNTVDHAIEGASLIHHGDFYYLFVSIDHCCEANIANVNYKEAVGRSTSPQGPFVDVAGHQMMHGASTVLLQGTEEWAGPGGGTAYIDPASGDTFLVFHALHIPEGGVQYVWLKQMTWQNDWPVIQ